MNDKSFLQSDLWQKFQQALGRKTFKIDGIYVYKHNLPLGKSFLYCPRADIAQDFDFMSFIQKMQEISRRENAIFLRLEPDYNCQLQIANCTLKITRLSPLQPQDTLTLDISQSEDEILAQMKPKTRYNIRLGQRHNLTSKISTDPKDIDIFWQLSKETSGRDNFRFHPKNYYQKMLEVLEPQNKAVILTIFQGKTPLSAAIILFDGDTAYYLHGASASASRNLMSTYLMQWEAILEAKKRGCQTYDFWGIAPEAALVNSQQSTVNSSKPHRWSGITRFKLGFAPDRQVLHYPPAYIFVFQPFWWQIYKKLKS
ncbi:MAG: hypothetical protein COX39_02510 [Candidatus Nealsonbacteria bacterium CG23_combo_of_CG06-09_8_20_14_all_40_13]|uniref:BioF2-like acetyltransferase domain-containing protein n=1 Tax=Candidatus Nealsonbacteria bacterium CG23_combo_of_CG06-09_8_20_14_all_40_13 TaxID=1974724 RepID=A0A2G9YQM4_9BACT|nr:MAG: hypothetical protein COX39_02510 [Candidatus Nealsonbacteria bacterium CG23_combo_of_CG06-09_8_20_14_all_40_13]PIR70897.1 MAG: hypothetical protein COU44_02640 [Candidatus Nealsonbacteria bacterium CG10_big_fil_rev_8_21_14_0_10_40_24]PIU42998.1 MAG: hypothetical protein COS97_03445 [Candidatus Nealsonbacteria bacterium CG07_land_8_20_14_0_80_40_10]